MEATSGVAAPSDKKIKAWQRFRAYEDDARTIDAERERALRVNYQIRGRAKCGQLRPFDVPLPHFRRRCAERLVRWLAASWAMGAPMLVGSQLELALLLEASPRAVRYALDELRGGWVEVVPAFVQCQRGEIDCHLCATRGVGHWCEVEHGYRPGPRLIAALGDVRRRLVNSPLAATLSVRVANLATRRSGSTRIDGRRAARSAGQTGSGAVELAAARDVVQRQRQGGGRAQPVPVAELLAARAELRAYAPPSRKPPTPPQPRPSAAEVFCAARACAAFRDVCSCPACRARRPGA